MMAKFCNAHGFMIWTMFILCVEMAVLGNAKMATGQCKGDVESLMKECLRFVQKSGPKTYPTPECCDVLKNVDLPCICEHIPGEVENIISMEKSVFVASVCGKPLVHGTKCGSYTVP